VAGFETALAALVPDDEQRAGLRITEISSERKGDHTDEEIQTVREVVRSAGESTRPPDSFSNHARHRI
jgi:hypothetical protein